MLTETGQHAGPPMPSPRVHALCTMRTPWRRPRRPRVGLCVTMLNATSERYHLERLPVFFALVVACTVARACVRPR